MPKPITKKKTLREMLGKQTKAQATPKIKHPINQKELLAKLDKAVRDIREISGALGALTSDIIIQGMDSYPAADEDIPFSS